MGQEQDVGASRCSVAQCQRNVVDILCECYIIE